MKSNRAYDLNVDFEEGFAEAVYNNQMHIAMHYLVEIISQLQSEIVELRSIVESKPAAKKTAPKKRTATKKAADKDE